MRIQVLQRTLWALRVLACLAAVTLPAWPLATRAHDIPNDVKVQAFVKPEGQRLLVLVRVPLGAMNEVDMPLRGPGYIDLARANPLHICGGLGLFLTVDSTLVSERMNILQQ